MSAGEITQGHRIEPGDGDTIFSFRRGDYEYDKDGVLWIRPPRGSTGRITLHDVTVHEDGTLTVSPSILLDGGSPEQSWHGYLERGVWREA